MTTVPVRRLVTPRDIDILSALERSPLTVRQLLKLSSTFSLPFQSERRVQERLQALCAAGRVTRRLYAVAGQGGAPSYYQLTLHGFRIIAGEDAQPPSRRAFSEVGIAHQHHTRSLAEFIVHTLVAAHRSGVTLQNFYRENGLRVDVGSNSLYPDNAFQLCPPGDEPLNFLVELDNGTERIRSLKDVESWERKLRLYNQLQDGSRQRFRVLVVCTRSSDRLRHILGAAVSLATNPQRLLVYGIELGCYLAEPDALRHSCFLDHHGRPAVLIPPTKRNRQEPPPGIRVAPAFRFC